PPSLTVVVVALLKTIDGTKRSSSASSVKRDECRWAGRAFAKRNRNGRSRLAKGMAGRSPPLNRSEMYRDARPLVRALADLLIDYESIEYTRLGREKIGDSGKVVAPLLWRTRRQQVLALSTCWRRVLPTSGTAPDKSPLLLDPRGLSPGK